MEERIKLDEWQAERRGQAATDRGLSRARNTHERNSTHRLSFPRIATSIKRSGPAVPVFFDVLGPTRSSS